MKKLLLASLVLASFGSQAQTTKKVIIEDFTGLWCPHCPKGGVILDGLEASNPTNLIPIASHNDGGYGGTADLLMIADGKTAASGLGVSAFPTGAVDRKLISGGKIPLGYTSWGSALSSRLATPAIASVGIGNKVKMADGSYEADIAIKFTSAPAAGVPIKVQVYILEDSIPCTGTLVQQNAPDGPLSGADPLTTATHKWYNKHVLRAALGGAWGFSDAVPATPAVGTTYTKHIKFTIPDASTTPATVPAGGWKKEQISVVAFVAYDGAAGSDKKEVLNAEEVSLKTFFPTSINNVEEKVSIFSAYPNPASLTSIVKVEYNIAASETVTMNVYNAMGQKVATPYVSNEVSGGHTIQWRPSENNLTPGTYFLEVATASGKQTQSIVLQ